MGFKEEAVSKVLNLKTLKIIFGLVSYDFTFDTASFGANEIFIQTV